MEHPRPARTGLFAQGDEAVAAESPGSRYKPGPPGKKMGVKQLPPSCATYLEQLLFLVPPLKTKLKTSTCNEILDAGNGIS
jgi:hypothetical protein